MTNLGASKGQHLKFAHQWLGLFLFLGLMIQGGLGYYHHRRFIADKPASRRWFTKVHLWFGRLLIFLALINMGLGMQLYGDPAGAQAGWYLIVIAVAAAYGYFYWRNFFRYRRHDAESFDPSKLEDPLKDDASTNDDYRPLNSAAAMSENDLGTYKSEHYDPDTSGVNEYGARIKKGRPVTEPTVTAIGLPTQAASSSNAGRRYDLSTPTPVIPGPYGSTEPLRTGHIHESMAPVVEINPPQDPFLDTPPTRPRTGVRPMTGARPMTGFRQPGPRPQTGIRAQTGVRPQTGRPPTGVMASMEAEDDINALFDSNNTYSSNNAYASPPYTAQSYASAQSVQSTQTYASAQSSHLSPPQNAPSFTAPAYTNQTYSNQSHSNHGYTNEAHTNQTYGSQGYGSQGYPNQAYSNQQQYTAPQ
jgi:hypothetical protein